jgi:hypothetical protein
MIEEFSQLVKQKFYSASQGNKEFLSNKGAAHANIIMSSMISYTKSELCIYTGCLSSYVYNAQELKSLADRLEPSQVRVICDPLSSHKDEPSIIKSILALTGGNKVEIRRLDSEIWGKIKDQINHFAVSDGANVRSEESHENFTASIYLCQPEIAKQRVVLFNKMWGVSKEELSL